MSFYIKILVGLLIFFPNGRVMAQAIWANKATPLAIEPSDVPCPATPLLIRAPDERLIVTLICQQLGSDAKYSLRVKNADGQTLEAPLDEGAHELLWSPNSKAFFVNGSLSSYAGFFVVVYAFKADHGVERFDVTKLAMRDMVSSFPPCRAWNRDGDKECKRIAENPDFNMSGIRWTANSSAIDIFAEVPCSSSYGGIMCQVKGYEVSASDGRILHRYSAKAIPTRWRNSMAWKMHVPDPARYGAANATYPKSQ